MNTTIDIDSTEEINQPRFYTEKATYTTLSVLNFS